MKITFANETSKKLCIYLYTAVLIVGLLPFSFGVFTLFSVGGFYLQATDFIYCTSEDTCIHEQAHRMDYANGNISQSEEFKTAVVLFAMQNTDHPWSKPILAYETGWPDVYARIYGSVKGNIDLIPAELQRFYH